MARSTFEGPILSGDNRFGALRDVGYARLTQSAGLDFSNTTSGTANYSGASGQFVVSNSIPNLNGNVYTCLLYTSPSPRDGLLSRMPSSA